MKGPKLLDKNVGILRTRMGACWPGSHAIFRGHDLHAELHDMDWVGLYLFGITGRRFSSEAVKLLHAIWVCTSYPDARLWNNRVAALAANARSSSNLGVTAAMAVSEATVYGGQACIRAMEFLMRANKTVMKGADVEEVVLSEARKRRVYGYGRPINSTDERIPWLVGLARKLDLDQGPHLKLAFEVERILLPKYPQLRMNYAALLVSLIADLGITVDEFRLLSVPMFLAGMAPCSVEASKKAEGTLFPTPCGGIRYEGVGKRSWIRQ